MFEKICLSLSVGLLLCLGGCLGTSQIEKNFVMTMDDRAEFSGMTAEEAIAKYDKLLLKARQEEVSYYSPKHFARATELVNEAKGLLADKEPTLEIFTTLTLSQKYIDEGYKITSRSQERLASVHDQKKYLDALNANGLYPSEYNDVLNLIKKSIYFIEDGELPKADENIDFLLSKMEEMEIRATLERTLGQTKALLASLEDADFPDFAPQAYSFATSAIYNAEKDIRNNVRDNGIVTQAGETALFAVNRVKAVGEEVLRLEDVDSDYWEIEVIAAEKHRQTLAQIMGCEDVRDRAIKEQEKYLTACAEKAVSPSATQ